jgi:hypothetical protein
MGGRGIAQQRGTGLGAESGSRTIANSGEIPMSGEAEMLAKEVSHLLGGKRNYRSQMLCPVCGENISAENCKPRKSLTAHAVEELRKEENDVEEKDS